MSEHSVDILTDGQWVPKGGILRWQGRHLAASRIQPQLGTPGTCGCGKLAYSVRARYCLDCHLLARQKAWRDSNRQRRKALNHGESATQNGGARGTLETQVNKSAPAARQRCGSGASPTKGPSTNA